MDHVDVLIVGAGISGIGAAWHLQKLCPDRTFVILEGRERIGGTWDLFRYPGIRSDSDMYTLGYRFRPWTDPKAIADGATIKNYLAEVVRDHDLERHIRFRHHVKRAAWSTADARWVVEATGPDGAAVQISCNFLYLCSGYYNYARGYAPDFPGQSDFGGRVIHPQFWPEDLDYSGKRVVVIGSGATAITLVPAMADKAARVTMLQRSPTYVVALPAQDAIANRLRKVLPAKVAYGMVRWKNVLRTLIMFAYARRQPARMKEGILKMVREQLGPDYDIDTHFTPRYNPWDQRLCVVPDGDLFAAIKAGKADVVTDRIARFDATGIVLESGRHLAADIIVPATGLELQLASDIAFSIDGEPRSLADSVNYKGAMFSDVPNLALTFGYTNASWTLKADLVAEYVCRLLNTMRKRGMRQATPRVAGSVGHQPFLDFTSGYVQRAMDRFPKRGDRRPWALHQNYARDLMMLRFGKIDEEMTFSNPAPAEAQRRESVAA